jgi:predicted transcriptional regulator
VPNQPATPGYTFRIPDRLMDPIKRQAEARGESLTDVVLTALEQYVRREMAKGAIPGDDED